MKYYLTFILIVSFAGIAVFGFTIFGDGMMHGGNCITSPIDGTPCPVSIIAMTLQHVSALQTLTTSTSPSAYNLLSLLAYILLVSVLVFLFYKNLLFPKLELSHRRLRDLASNFSYSQQKITSWLSLFENSPAF